MEDLYVRANLILMLFKVIIMLLHVAPLQNAQKEWIESIKSVKYGCRSPLIINSTSHYITNTKVKKLEPTLCPV